MMDLTLNEAQEMMKKAARDFLEKECPPAFVRRMEEDEKGYSPQMWRRMAELAWLGLVLPEEYEGLGEDLTHLVVLAEEMGRALLPSPYFSTVACARLITLAGSEAQKKALLPPVTRGEAILSLAYLEPSGSYDPEALEAKARVGKDEYVLEGTKLLVPYAHVADWLLFVGRSDGGISLFLVDRNSRGVSCTPLTTLSLDKQSEVVFDRVRIPQKNLVGETAKGWDALRPVLEEATVFQCAQMVGAAEKVLEMSVNWAKERVQYGRPIGSFQAVQWKLVNMWGRIDGARAVTYAAAAKLGEGLPSSKEVSAAKAWCSDMARYVAYEAHQVFAGIGFMQEHDLQLFSRRLKAYELNLGDTRFHREAVAQALGL